MTTTPWTDVACHVAADDAGAVELRLRFALPPALVATLTAEAAERLADLKAGAVAELQTHPAVQRYRELVDQIRTAEQTRGRVVDDIEAAYLAVPADAVATGQLAAVDGLLATLKEQAGQEELAIAGIALERAQALLDRGLPALVSPTADEERLAAIASAIGPDLDRLVVAALLRRITSARHWAAKTAERIAVKTLLTTTHRPQEESLS